MKNYFQNLFQKILAQRKNKELLIFALCTAVATTFWFLNRLNNTFTTTIQYPLEYEYNKMLNTVTKPLPEHISLKVQGNGWKIFEKIYLVRKKPFKIKNYQVVERNFVPTTAFLPYATESLSDLKLEKIEPDTLFCSFERRIIRKIPVRLDSSFIMKPNYRIVGNVDLDPDTVIVQGAFSLVHDINFVNTEPFIKKDLNGNIEANLKLMVAPKMGLEFSSLKTKVKCVVKEFVEEKRELSVVRINFPMQFEFDTTNKYVVHTTFNILKEDRHRVHKDSFMVTLDYRQINPEQSQIPLFVQRIPSMIWDFNMSSPIFKLKK